MKPMACVTQGFFRKAEILIAFGIEDDPVSTGYTCISVSRQEMRGAVASLTPL